MITKTKNGGDEFDDTLEILSHKYSKGMIEIVIEEYKGYEKLKQEYFSDKISHREFFDSAIAMQERVSKYLASIYFLFEGTKYNPEKAFYVIQNELSKILPNIISTDIVTELDVFFTDGDN